MKNKCHVNWFELFVSDFEKAMNFYSNMFGWEFRLMSGIDKEYWTIFTGFNSPGGGLMKREGTDYSKQGTRIYVEVDDIELLLLRAKDYGGSICQEKKAVSENAGYFALLYDPDENVIGLWSTR